MFHRLLVLMLLLGCIAPLRAHDGGHCTKEEFLEFDVRIGAVLLQTTEKLIGEELEKPHEFAEWFAFVPAAMLNEEAMFEWFLVRMGEWASMTAPPRLCEEVVPVYLAALRILRIYPLSYILSLSERLPEYEGQNESMARAVADTLTVELENAILAFVETSKAGYVTLGLERPGS